MDDALDFGEPDLEAASAAEPLDRQDGPGLFDVPLPGPEPACDIAAANGEIADRLPAAADRQPPAAEPGRPRARDGRKAPRTTRAPRGTRRQAAAKKAGEPAAGSDAGPAAATIPAAAGEEPQQPVPAENPAPPDSPAGEDGPPVAGNPTSTAEAPGSPESPAAGQDPPGQRPAMPLALYRRYRPDTFAEVIGQEHVTEPLCRAIANNKVNHAYLFSGPRGCGKTTSARILARCLNCAEGPTPTPCGVCDSCRALATGGPGSIDVIEIDAASHGRVDDARELREGVYFAPVSSRYKIYIIDEAHMVTKEGFNALLKVVEEPPEHVKFIFATTEPDKVIGTIKSRTHHYPFRLVPPRTLIDYLERICAEEGVEVERGVLPLVVRAGAGSVRDSLSVLDQLLGAASRQLVGYAHAAALLGYTPDALLDEIVDAFAAGDGRGVFATIDKVIEVGQDPRRFAEDLLTRIRDLVIVAQVPDAIGSGLIEVADDQAERLTAQAAALGAGELTRAAEVIATGLVAMRGTTAPRLHLELICARVLLPTADRDGRGLHARLDRLERRLDMPGLLPGRGRPEAPAPRDWDDDPEATGRHDPVSRGVAPGRPGSGQADERFAGGQPARRQPAQEPSAGAVAGRQPATQRPGSQPPAAQRPAGQRPAHPGRAGQPPADGPARSPQGIPVSGQPPGGPAPAGVGTADLRRLWPQILDEVKRRKRFSHALISQNAHVIEVRGRELLLGFANQPTLDRFRDGGSSNVLHDAIVAVLGADLHVSAAVDGGPSQSGPAARPAEQQRPTRGATRPGAGHGAADPAADGEPAGIAPVGGHRPHHGFATEPPPEEDWSDQAAADDIVLDESGEDAAQLVVRELGAQLIEETES